MRNHCKKKYAHTLRSACKFGGGGGGTEKNIAYARLVQGGGGGGGGGGSKTGEFGRNTFWIVPSGNYNDITFMNFTSACSFQVLIYYSLHK